MVTTLLLGTSLAMLQRQPVDHEFRYPHPEPDLSGARQLIWDDSVDGEIKSSEKNCDVAFRIDGATVTGVMSRLPGEVGRSASIVGRVSPHADGGRGLLTFQQVEGDYVCNYQVFFGMSGATGQWMDNQGRSGDFTMLKYQQIRTTETGGR